MNSNEGLESFLPLVSSDIFGGLSERECDVNYLAKVVIAEVFLLKLCLDFKVETSGHELEKELSTWAIGSITTFGNYYLFGYCSKLFAMTVRRCYQKLFWASQSVSINESRVLSQLLSQKLKPTQEDNPIRRCYQKARYQHNITIVANLQIQGCTCMITQRQK
ncbi:hypothetical protein ACFX15_006278 [Malus domestica]